MLLIAATMTLLVLCVTLAACVSDIMTMRIPNWHTAVVLAAFALAFAATPQFFGRWWEHVGALVLVFLPTFFLYHKGMFGGGDTKFGSALALWVGLKGIMIYLFYLTLAGGVLGCAALFFRHKKPLKNPRAGSWPARAQEGKSAVPYGVAISAGLWASFFHTGFLDRVLHEVIKTIH
jgi:prepilin peptidase CpaA